MNVECNIYSESADTYSGQNLSSQSPINKSSNDLSSFVKQEFLDSLDKSTLAIRDAQGNFQLAWVRELIISSHYLDNLQALEELLLLIQTGGLEGVKKALQVGISRKLRFLEGDTLLHLAVRYQQLDIVNFLLQDIPLVEIKELLQQTNIQRKTPIELGRSHAEIYSILSHFQQIVEKENCSSPTTPLSISENDGLALTWNTIVDLEKQLTLLTDESQFESFTPYLVPLCQLAALICQQAIKTLEVNKKIEELSKELLFPLFGGKFDILDRCKLHKNIFKVYDFYQSIIQKNIINDKIKLSVSYLKLGTTTYEGIIYLNPLESCNKVTEFIITMLHEASHLVNLSEDIKYAKLFIDVWAIEFQPCTQLTTEDGLVIPAERLQLLALECLLENKSNLANHLAHGNADTFAVATLALAASYGHCATISDAILLIKAPQFLKNLSSFSELSPVKRQPILKVQRVLLQIQEKEFLSADNRNQEKGEDGHYSDASTAASSNVLPVESTSSKGLPNLSNHSRQSPALSALSQTVAAISMNNGSPQPTGQWVPTRAISKHPLFSLLSMGKAAIESHQANLSSALVTHPDTQRHLT
ncbi:MAG: hypothetical protein AB2993_06995 [Candidatus Symbiodolus clandestinus]